MMNFEKVFMGARHHDEVSGPGWAGVSARFFRLFAILAFSLTVQSLSPPPGAVAATSATRAAGSERWEISVQGGGSAGAGAVLATHQLSGEIRTFTLAEGSPGWFEAPSIHFTPGGRAAATWIWSNSGEKRVFFSLFDGTGWREPRAVSPAGTPVSTPSVALAPDGSVWIAWVVFDGRDDEIAAAHLRADGRIIRRWMVTHNEVPDITPVIDGKRGGRAEVTWFGFRGDGYHARKAELRQVGRMRGVAPQAPLSGSPLLAFDEGGFQSASGIPATDAEDQAAAPTQVAWFDGVRVLRGPFANLAAGSSSAGREIKAADRVPRSDTVYDFYDRTFILGLGDSVTYGRGSLRDGPPTDYLSRLEAYLKGPWVSVNRGIPGATSAQVLSETDTALVTVKPGLAILMVGINDTFWGLSPETTLFNIETILEMASARGGDVVICSTTPVLPERRYDQYQRLAVLNPLIADLAHRKGYPFVDFWGIFVNTPGWKTLLMDQLSANHPNDRGHDLLAARMREVITGNDLLLGDIDWVAVKPLQPGKVGSPGNQGAAAPLLADPYSALAGDHQALFAPLDVNGDGRDEIGAVRTISGRQVFFLYSAPPVGAATPEELTAAVRVRVRDAWVYPAGGWITHLFRIDRDGDGVDEVGLVKWDDAAKTQFVEIFSAHPFGTTTEQKALLARRWVYDAWRLPYSGRLRDVAPIQVDNDPADEVAVLLEDPVSGDQSLRIFDTPPPALTREGNTAAILYLNKWTLPKGILRIAGQDIDADGRDELLILRLGVAAQFDVLEAYRLPAFPARSELKSVLTLRARDHWARVQGSRQYAIAPLRLWDEDEAALREVLAIWRNR